MKINFLAGVLRISVKLAFFISVLLAVSSCDKNPVQAGPISGEPVTDIEGNVYHTVIIGNQVWTVENLRTTKFNDGLAIPLVTDSTLWETLSTPGFCYYKNTTNTDHINKFGALYNWYTIDTKKLAPNGWHVPTSAEWDTLESYLIHNGYIWDGSTSGNGIAKSMAERTDWNTSQTPGDIGNDLTKNNKSGFSALPGGFRNIDGTFDNINITGLWWCATAYMVPLVYHRDLYCYFSTLNSSFCGSSCGLSVRLVKD